jgi:hypothetical protein
MRLKGGGPGGAPGGGGPGGGKPAESSNAAPGASNGGGEGGAARGDLQQMLTRLPASSLSDFQKGDAVMIVSTEGSGDEVTAITVVGGVEPILTASPKGTKDMILSPWSLSAPEGGG